MLECTLHGELQECLASHQKLEKWDLTCKKCPRFVKKLPAALKYQGIIVQLKVILSNRSVQAKCGYISITARENADSVIL